MENCSLALRTPEYGSEAMEIACVESTMDAWSFAVDVKVDLQWLLYRIFQCRSDEVGSFTPNYNMMK